jgi:hypothetical protein
MTATKISSAEEWRAALGLVYDTAGTLGLLPLADMVQQADRAQAIGPLLDPTLWMRNGEAVRQDLEVLKAAHQFVSRVQALVEKAATREGAHQPLSPPGAETATEASGPVLRVAVSPSAKAAAPCSATARLDLGGR